MVSNMHTFHLIFGVVFVPESRLQNQCVVALDAPAKFTFIISSMANYGNPVGFQQCRTLSANCVDV